jgi:hypothetical protein
MQQDGEDDIEPQRVFTKTAQPQTEPSWAAIEAERLHRIEQAIARQGAARLAARDKAA